MRSGIRSTWLFVLPLAAMVVLLATPLAILLGVSAVNGLFDSFRDPAFLASVGLTILGATAAGALAIALGTPTAYAISRGLVRGKPRAIAEALIASPLTVPHVVAGIAILITFSPISPLYPLLGGIPVFQSFVGLTMAFFFVSSPIYVSALKDSVAKSDVRLELAARALGASPASTFLRIVVPNLRASILESFLLSWARSMSEFGSVAILAYFVVGPPLFNYVSPASVFVWNAFQISGLFVALRYSGALLLISLLPLVVLQALRRRP